MRKWYDEEYEFQVEVTGYLRGDHTEHLCRNGEEIGDKYRCTYGCPVNADGYGICSKTMMMFIRSWKQYAAAATLITSAATADTARPLSARTAVLYSG